MEHTPDFYLTTTEFRRVFEPRACYIKDRIKASDGREDYMLVAIDPVINGLHGNNDTEEVILATRHAGATLYPINEWPLYVYVCKIKNNDIKILKKANSNDLIIMFWGELHKYCDEAEKASRSGK